MVVAAALMSSSGLPFEMLVDARGFLGERHPARFRTLRRRAHTLPGRFTFSRLSGTASSMITMRIRLPGTLRGASKR